MRANLPRSASCQRLGRVLAVALALLLPLPGQATESDPEIAALIAALDSERSAAGVSAATVARATNGLTRDPEVAALAAAQPEHDLTTGTYLTRVVTAERIEGGRQALARDTTMLHAIEARYGVDRHILLAIWGIETKFGTVVGHRSVVRSLATLALVDQRRAAFWRRELVAALAMLEHGDAQPEDLVGSWAGAIGHTQFMPTTFRTYAVDFDGDGRRDLWRTPADALASTAAYLKASGWRAGEPWGLEVRLPAGFDVSLTGAGRRPVSFWRDQGFVPAGAWPSRNLSMRLLLPAGAGGPAFLVAANFNALLSYNPSASYALAVGHLADRIGGGPALAAAWPERDRGLARAEREELQRLLAAAGHDPGPVDGLLGGLTRTALRSYQKQRALPQDGYPSIDVLERLRMERAGALP